MFFCLFFESNNTAKEILLVVNVEEIVTYKDLESRGSFIEVPLANFSQDSQSLTYRGTICEKKSRL